MEVKGIKVRDREWKRIGLHAYKHCCLVVQRVSIEAIDSMNLLKPLLAERSLSVKTSFHPKWRLTIGRWIASNIRLTLTTQLLVKYYIKYLSSCAIALALHLLSPYEE